MISIALWPLIESQRLRSRIKALTLNDSIPERTVGLLTHKNRKPCLAVPQFIDSLYQSIAATHQFDGPVLKCIFKTIDLQI